MRRFVFCLFISSLCAGAVRSEEANDFFEKEVRPLLANTCFECHGEAKHKGGLRMNSRAAILKGGQDGTGAVPGKPAESMLIKAISYKDEELKMPPKTKLKDKDIETLTKWVSLGMPWPGDAPIDPKAVAPDKPVAYQITEEQRKFWSFQPIKAEAAPVVKQAAWPHSDIDKFILAAMESKGVDPAPQADKRTLIRRATFDLTGLPPAPPEIDAFLTDNSPQAFATVVERLLASPHYGERWGRHWLDLVRYADSRDSRGQGSEGDITDAWRYRDWVVNALNRDLPYDQFIVNQIAGDLLPAKEPGGINADGLIATGLLTIGEWGNGDADKDKMMTDIVDDQVDVVSRAIMGLTVACARCHDHKFDPIPTADYYSLAGIFFSTHIIPFPGKKTDGSPMLHTPLVPESEVAKFNEHKKRLEQLEKDIPARADKEYNEKIKSLLPQTSKYLMAAWEYSRDTIKLSPNLPQDTLKKQAPATAPVDQNALIAFAATRGLDEYALHQWIDTLALSAGSPAPYTLMTTPVRDVAGNIGVHTWRGKEDCPNLIINTTDKEVAITTLKLPPKTVSIHPGPNNGVAVAWKSPITGNIRISGKVTDADNVCGDGIAWVIEHQSASLKHDLASGAFVNGGAQGFEQGAGAAQLNSVPVQPGDMIFLVVLPKSDYSCDSTLVDFTLATTDNASQWNFARDIVADPHQGNPHSDHMGNANVWHFIDMADGKKDKTSAIALENALQGWKQAVSQTAPRQDAIEQAAQDFQKAVNAAKVKDALYTDLTGPNSPFAIHSRDDAKYLKPETASELAKLRAELDTLKKNPLQPIPVALAAQEGGVPQSIHAGINDAHIHIRGSYTRPGEKVPRRFPRIIAGDNQTPIAKGSGRLELARWLASPKHPLTARVMVNRIWQYHFGEGIVRTPSNYGKLGERPSHPELLDYLASQFIHSGWSIKAMHRAIMLSAAYQQSSEPSKETLKADPDNKLFSRMNRRRLEAEALRDSLLAVSGRLDTRMGSPADKDPMTTRRMLYLMSVRSDRSSFGPLFDAADSAAQVERRTISTVAPQALFMLDHAFVLDQTSALVKRVLAQTSDDPGRIADAYLLLYGRPPVPEESQIGLEFLKRTRAKGISEELAWTEYCQVLFCANELVFVD